MRHFDLCIIGTGSGNSIIDERFDHLSVALVEMGTFGGTCLNVGCIPSKMFVYPADLAGSTIQAERLGVDLDLSGVRWREIRDRIFGRIDPMAAKGRAYREQSDNVTVFEARHASSDAGAGRWRGRDDHCRPVRDRCRQPAGNPRPDRLDSVDYHTSDTVMRLAERPKSMIIIGGGYIAAEFAHMFAAYGTAGDRTQPVRTCCCRLRTQDIAERFTELLGRRVDIRLNTSVDVG